LDKVKRKGPKTVSAEHHPIILPGHMTKRRCTSTIVFKFKCMDVGWNIRDSNNSHDERWYLVYKHFANVIVLPK